MPILTKKQQFLFPQQGRGIKNIVRSLISILEPIPGARFVTPLIKTITGTGRRRQRQIITKRIEETVKPAEIITPTKEKKSRLQLLKGKVKSVGKKLFSTLSPIVTTLKPFAPILIPLLGAVLKRVVLGSGAGGRQLTLGREGDGKKAPSLTKRKDKLLKSIFDKLAIQKGTGLVTI